MRIVVLVLLLLTTLTPSAQAAGITEVTGFGTNPGNLRMFRYVPDGLPAGRPVVVALHGCTQDAAGYGTASGWVALADRYRFSVLLPQQQNLNNLNKCFNWFQTADTTRGQGEAASIAQMITKTAAGPAYVTGLSAGGAMTSVMLADYPEVFRGGGIVAGLPHGCATSVIDAYSCMNPGKNLTPQQWGDKVRAASPHTGPRPPVTIWHGTADYTVATANQRELVDQWTNALGTDTTADTTDTVAGHPHSVYRDASGAPVVETYTITGMGHGQPVDPGTGAQQCGTATAYVLDVNVCAAWHLAQRWGLGA
ncbi:PHB depolymerase family esterase [Umezawaea sp. Da 62-37]|uniref:extracellular catalytic domain type 1 short-chain-length polyhydroxyalkanoate depolymerase n=1 Tax=Umezawaea sp. Da 62-37 TaxID=3075927 RepID=UPI0028F7167A|nr:PHB depolymerase family esterase [Umezawaea sp. Da 62-37]WNV83825.1 PHB depolymerase family esterase [Umezawaea sp. Da 62-37]